VTPQPLGPGRFVAVLAVGWFGLMAVATALAVVPLGWGARLAGPDVVLAVLLYVGLQAREGPIAAASLASLLGYLADLFGGAPKGLYMIAYVVALLVARAASARLLVRGQLVVALVAFFYTLGFGLLVALLRVSFEPEVGWGALRQLPSQAAATALVAPLVFRVLGRLDRRFVRDPRLLRSIA
jgi:rod shape-determining protein MreD